MKRLLVVATMLLCCATLTAQQRQSDSKEYYKSTGYGTIKMPGKFTRSYIVNDEGKKLLEGPLTVNCNLASTNVSVWPYTFTLSGTYTSNANFSKNKLNGAASSSYKLNVRKNGSSPETKTEYQTFSGSFLNGVPNGAFKMDCNGELKLTATYKNGNFVGAFYYEEVLAKHKITGTLTQDSKPTGQWIYKSDALVTQTMQFQNGVLISEHYVDTSNLNPVDRKTDADISAIATQYATGAISEDEVYNKGYLIIEGKLDIGSKAQTALVDYSSFIGFTSKNLYDFTGPESVSYKTLIKANVLNEEGVKRVTEALIEWDKANAGSGEIKSYDDYSSYVTIPSGWDYEEDTTEPEEEVAKEPEEEVAKEPESTYVQILCRVDASDGESYYDGYMRVLDSGVAYVQFINLDESLLITHNGSDKCAYLTAKDLEAIMQAMHESRVARAKDLEIDTNLEPYKNMPYYELRSEGVEVPTMYPHPTCAEYVISSKKLSDLLSYYTKSSYDKALEFQQAVNNLIEERKNESYRGSSLRW